jgi:hypothetical protein
VEDDGEEGDRGRREEEAGRAQRHVVISRTS